MLRGRGVACAWRLLERLQAKKVDPTEALRTQTEALAGTHGGILFTRMPLTLPPKPKWETDYLDWQREWHSYTGKHRPWPEWLEDGDGVGDAGASGQGQAGMGTSGEGDERVPAPLEQPADVSGDRRTIQRRLDSHLYLILRSKEAKGGHWFFPSVPHEATETIRQTCERALATFVDSSAVDTFFIGNGPCGMVPLRPDAAEDKVFLIPVELIKGSPQIKVETKVADFAWAAKDEMGDYFKNEATLAYLDRLLQDKSDYYGFATSQTY